jgi:hypothetical protein
MHRIRHNLFVKWQGADQEHGKLVRRTVAQPRSVSASANPQPGENCKPMCPAQIVTHLLAGQQDRGGASACHPTGWRYIAMPGEARACG